jgi:tRNA dimethylallyltransferase
MIDKSPEAGSSNAGHHPHVILIAGPTASGKSALAMGLAEETGAIIVNADSMQVYTELPILTARPSPVDEARAPHRLYGIRSVRDSYSVADWLRDVAPLIEAARAGGPPLAIVGGTGLYFKALTEGLAPVPDIPQDVRQHWRAQAGRLGAVALHAELARRDAAMAERLRPSDPQRITRALEVLEATGRSLGEWQSMEGDPLLGQNEAEKLYVCPPRAELYARCDARLDRMIGAGALAEVEALMAMDLPPDRPATRALGVAPLTAYLRGQLSFSAAMERAKTETRRYAKRQMTWGRRNMMSWEAVLEK